MGYLRILCIWIPTLWFSSQSMQLKRIAILGCGPAGLCLSSVLVKFLPSSWDGTISMYDSRSDILQTNLGGGIQVSGGNNVLIKLGLFEKFREIAQPINSILSRNKDSQVLFQLNVPELINRDKYENRNLLYSDRTKTSASEYELSNPTQQLPLKPLLYSIMRDALQQMLYDSIKDDPRVRIFPSTTCVNIVEAETIRDIENSDVHTTVALKFTTEKQFTSDDKSIFNSTSNDAKSSSLPSPSYLTAEEFDAVFCTDGIKSIGINHIINSWAKKEATLTSNKSGLENALGSLYDKLSKGWKSGLRISYGITDVDNTFSLRPASCEKSSNESFHQYFGDGCYALIASYGGLKQKDNDGAHGGGVQHMLAVVYTGDGNDGSSVGDRSNAKWNSNVAVRDQVLNRLKKSGLETIPDIMTVFCGCMDERWIDLGVRDRILPLRHWGSVTGKVVLCGDSAHAMPPFFGQGANQALQDSYMLGKGLADVIRLQQSYHMDFSNKYEKSDLSPSVDLQWKEVIQNYENKRKIFTALLSAKSSILGRIETLGGDLGVGFRDTFLRVVYTIGVVEKSFLDAARPRI